MGTKALLATLLAVLMGCAHRSGDADANDAKSILEKAIKAQGGEDKLGQFKAARWKGRGTLVLNGQNLPVTLETVYQLPDKYKTAMHFDVQGRKIGVIQVLVGDKGWMTGQGKTVDLTGSLLKALKEEFYAATVEQLVPLLREKGYTLTLLEETKVSGKPAVGIKVTATGHKDIQLYFDRDSLLPVKTVKPSIDAQTMKEVTIDVIYSDFKAFDGVMSPTKMVAYQDGKKLMDVEVAEYNKLDKVDADEFVEPK